MLILERSGCSRLVRLYKSHLASHSSLLVGVDRDIREQDPAAFATLNHALDGIEQLPRRTFGLAKLARRLEIFPGDHEGIFDELRNSFHGKPTPPRIKRSLLSLTHGRNEGCRARPLSLTARA